MDVTNRKIGFDRLDVFFEVFTKTIRLPHQDVLPKDLTRQLK